MARLNCLSLCGGVSPAGKCLQEQRLGWEDISKKGTDPVYQKNSKATFKSHVALYNIENVVFRRTVVGGREEILGSDGVNLVGLNCPCFCPFHFW